MSDVSQLLEAWGGGDKTALERLMPLVYRELRYLARRQMRRERSNHSLQPTELVNEAYLRLVQQRAAQWQHRAQFFAVAASIMRRILVDHARRSHYQKRGGGAVRMSLDEVDLVSAAPAEQIVALDGALQALEAVDQRKSQVVELRYFAGLSIEEIAHVLSVSPVTVKRDWALAKTWLYRHMSRAFKQADGVNTNPPHPHRSSVDR
jgi:RNA polymerase sigma-70 factor, ECF subfamily